MNTSIEYVTMPAALRVASSISVITLLRGSLGSSSTVAVPRSFSYCPTVPKLKPPKAADWPGNMLGACERAGSQVTLLMRASASCESENAASAAVTASAILVFIAPPLEYCFLVSPASSRPLRPRRRDDDLHHGPLGSVHFAGVPTKLTHS